MDAAAFVDKWRKSRRSERSASQEHFLDLCEVLKHPKPGAVDPKGLTFTTERRVVKGKLVSVSMPRRGIQDDENGGE